MNAVRPPEADELLDADELEFDHRPVEIAKPGQQVGVHVSHRVREGDVVMRIA